MSVMPSILGKKWEKGHHGVTEAGLYIQCNSDKSDSERMLNDFKMIQLLLHTGSISVQRNQGCATHTDYSGLRSDLSPLLWSRLCIYSPTRWAIPKAVWWLVAKLESSAGMCRCGSHSRLQDNAGTRCSSGHVPTGQVIGFVEAAKHATAGIATFADWLH